MLYELLSNHRDIAIVGMCKNAGKTTVLNALLKELFKRGERVAISSIGHDGERVDLVTQTPKPPIFVEEGTLIATAEGLLGRCDCTKEIVDTTNISTPLGRVIIFNARTSGFVEIAGASMTADLPSLSKRLHRLGADRVIIDGAVFRKSTAGFGISDAVILSTGASYSADAELTASDTAHIVRLLSLKGYGGRAREISGSLSDEVKSNPNVRNFYIRGALTCSMLLPVLKSSLSRPLRLIIRDGSCALISRDTMKKCDRMGIELRVRHESRLLFVSINPYSAYGEHQSGARLKKLLEERINVPVIDVAEVR
ncbi:MAG: hypothetical protein Q4C01_01000 [Clostridia bacterium]|nr:hypothetical protein [Clostridia bacterium]